MWQVRPVQAAQQVAPHARAEYLQALEHGDQHFIDAGITTPQRLAHFLAQILEETGGLTITEESGNYSAERIREVWPSRPEAVQYAHNPQALFNHVYANRMGNGPPESGDGYRYLGRGPLQTTGKENYDKYGKRCGADFLAHPEYLYSAQYALLPALSEWTDGGCNAMADRDDIVGITKRINGGETGLGERERYLHRLKPLIDKVDLVPTSSLPSTPVIVTTAGGTAAATAAHHGLLTWSTLMSTLQVSIDIVVAAVVLYVAMSFAEDVYNSTGSVWQRLLAAGKQSATILWQRIVVMLTGLIGGAAWIADLLNAPNVGTAINTYVKPQYVAILFVASAVITELARRRTLLVQALTPTAQSK